ncbi:rna polymerase iipaf1 [Diaporthe amygdali]|uniref:rna polymerase iipaf1 n=1 Tax=Phomopsis amygdali TaxID=1214568 RepID=UPI0022FEB179|nr:rna polymerase iipaf1 [Diaporthe amygdali]KAJ0118473.1 rna polymerase iipaf1 [Diaporthe amygdali]
MSSSQSSHARQDFIARIRYSNALPPPPNPPKLLDIPNTGLASGQYTTPGFASRLAREQPLNIEADAELGMPLDLVGMPGVFDGDESSTLGKPKVAGAAVSFLRRTEYISNANTTTKSSPFRQAPKNTDRRPPKRKSPEPDIGTPAYVKRKIEKGFEAAQENLKDKSRIRHPTKPPVAKFKNLRVVEAYPVLPDLDAFPDSGAYVTYKFAHPPIPKDGTYDKRLLNSILKYNRSPEEEDAYNQAVEAHNRDPENHPKPPNQQPYNFYLADKVKHVDMFRQRFDLRNPNRDDDSLNPETKADSGKPAFEYNYARTYNAVVESELDHDTKYSEELVFGIDPVTKVAWYYPSMQRMKLEPPRRIHNQFKREKNEVDEIDIVPVDPSDEWRLRMELCKANPLVGPDPPQEDEHDADAEVEEAMSHDGDGGRRGRDDSEEPAATNGRNYSEEPRVESEQDAEGDEDE